jgi:histidine triad (HIT) family protein
MWWDVDEERRNLDPDCVFCKVIDGELPSRKVYSDDTVVAFHDASPVSKVHILIVPRTHVTQLADSHPENEELLGHLLRVGPMIAERMGIAASGYRLAINQGIDAGQVVDHLHMHVLGGQELYPLGEMRTGTEG